MDDDLRRALSRRELLRRSGGLLALAGLAPVIAACGGSDSGGTTAAPAATSAAGSTGGASTAAAKAGDIKMWWWGEQEAVGIQKWMDDVLAAFSERADRQGRRATLMDTDQVIPQFTKAAAAGDVPDVQFLFNGIYHMENVWLGYLVAARQRCSALRRSRTAAARSCRTTRASSTAPASTRSASAIEYNKAHVPRRRGSTRTTRRRPGTRSSRPARS